MTCKYDVLFLSKKMWPLMSSPWRCPYCASDLQEVAGEWINEELADRGLRLEDSSIETIRSLLKYYCLKCDLFFEDGAVKQLVFHA